MPLCQGRDDGFTLTELMIALVVMALLSAIAYPLYSAQVKKSRRVAAQTTLLELATRQTEWRSRHSRYGELTELLALPPALSEPDDSHYDYAVSADTASFAITATPRGSQSDDDCGVLQLTQDLSGGPADCW